MFDYFGVLVSVIFGLALTHILRGLAKLLQSYAPWIFIAKSRLRLTLELFTWGGPR